jgi:hypothetical protein
MRSFFRSPAGVGTIAVYAAGLLLAWPPALSWLVAVVMLVFAIGQFRESFRRLDAEETATPKPIDRSDTATVLALPARGDARPCDGDTALTVLAAQAARPLRDAR